MKKRKRGFERIKLLKARHHLQVSTCTRELLQIFSQMKSNEEKTEKKISHLKIKFRQKGHNKKKRSLWIAEYCFIYFQLLWRCKTIRGPFTFFSLFFTKHNKNIFIIIKSDSLQLVEQKQRNASQFGIFGTCRTVSRRRIMTIQLILNK